MSVTGPGSITALNLTAQTNMFSQLTTLSQELGTGQAAQTFSGLDSQAGVAVELGAQVSAINGYSATATNVSTTLSVAQSVLGQLSQAGAAVAQSITQQGTFTLDGNGQTTTQQAAAGYLSQILDLLNTQVGGNYMFSGSAVNQPAVASTNDILNGNGAQQGLTQTIAQRLQADEGAGNNGRLTVGGTSPAVTLSSDGSPFGFQLAGVNSSLTGATASGPTGSPPTITINLGSNPNAGDTISFALTLPDGSSQTISLQATTASPPGANQFTIGADQTATGANLQTALGTAIGNLAQTALPAASAIAASNNFFADPPQIVTPPYSSAMTLTNGTAANTVFWYTGENGSDAGTADRDRAGRPVDDHRLRDARHRAGDHFARRQCGGFGRDHILGGRSECPGELSGAVAERARQSQRPVRHAVDQQHRKRHRQRPDHGEKRHRAQHADAKYPAGHAAGFRGHQSDPDRRTDFDVAEHALGVDVGDGAARAIEPGQFPGPVQRLIARTAERCGRRVEMAPRIWPG